MEQKDWIGRTEERVDVATQVPAQALAATFDRAGPAIAAGTPLSPLWHWLYFLPLNAMAEVGADGHPRRGGFLPPVPLPRRMWAGSAVEFLGDVRVGDALVRRSHVDDVVEKTGKSGTLVFVNVRHEVARAGDGALLVRERQDLVYRDAPVPGTSAPPPKQAPATSAWEQRWTPDEVLLFRFSALTFNSHRIHYDLRYTTQVEGYPGLVVQGPLIALLLLELVAAKRPQARVARFDFRAVRPSFANRPLHCCGEPDAEGGTVRLWARGDDGAVALEATATLT